MRKENRNLKISRYIIIAKILFLLLFFVNAGLAQTYKNTYPKPKPVPKSKPIETPPDEPDDSADNGDIPFEKSILVDEKVNIGLCVTEGNIRINGWNRNELRIFIVEGSKAYPKVHNKNSNGEPSRITLLGFDPAKSKSGDQSQCLSGEQIELDVPFGTNISSLTGVEGEVTVSVQSINRAVVKINEGNITLQGIRQKILAQTFEGDISVEDCNGNIDLNTTSGNILAFNLQQVEDGDSLRMKTTNGTILIQSANHSIIDASSISGSVRYSGKINPEGQYKFTSTSGNISLEIPQDSSCMFEISSQKNKLNYQLPLKILTEELNSPLVRRITAQNGNGEALVSVVSGSGKISIAKKN